MIFVPFGVNSYNGATSRKAKICQEYFLLMKNKKKNPAGYR